jgi:hypothetical protein
MQISNLDSPANHWRRTRVWALVAVIGALAAWLLVGVLSTREGGPTVTQEGGKDLQAYRQIVERVHAGEDYYSAAGDELRSGGYATSSVFNWRLPTSAWLLAALPRPEWGQVLLSLLALAALALAYAADRQQGSIVGSAVLVVTMAGAFLWCVDGDAYFAQELWAGVLIAVSVGAFAVGRRGWGLAAGLAVLPLRELGLPYVLVALVLACREIRWREATTWCVGLAAFAVFFAWHAWQVHQHFTGSEHVQADGWIQFGGPVFVLRTCQMNAWIFRMPTWVAFLYLAASLLGMAAWRGPVKTRVAATVGVYLVAFLVVGKSFNNYWGLLYAPLLPWGFVRFPLAIRTFLPFRGGFTPRICAFKSTTALPADSSPCAAAVGHIYDNSPVK